MHVTFDDQSFTSQPRGGIARYFAELIDAFQTAPELGVEVRLPFTYVVSDYLLESDPTRFRRPPLPERLQRGRVLRGLNRVRRGPRPAATGLLHQTYYFPDALHAPARTRICTIYDMIPETYPEFCPPENPHHAKHDYVREADAILAISQTTKNELVAHYGQLDKPIVVTPLGVSDRFWSARASGVDTVPYTLFVGQRGWYKNFDVALRALPHLEGPLSTLELWCVGPPFDEAETARIQALGLTRRVKRLTVSDAQLPGLYAGAACLVFPSRCEGFGLPIVEAFAAGCPALLAEAACSIEVGGEAAQFFAPDDDQTLAALLSRMASDPAERERWVDAGRRRGRDFTWRRTAELTRDLYAELDRKGR